MQAASPPLGTDSLKWQAENHRIMNQKTKVRQTQFAFSTNGGDLRSTGQDLCTNISKPTPLLRLLHQETQSSKCIESYKRSRWEYFIPEISIPFQTMKSNTHRGKAKSFSWSSWLRVGNGMMGMNDLLEEKGPEVLGWSFNGRQSMPSYFSHLFYLFRCVCDAGSREKKMVVGTRFSSFLVLRKGRRRGTVNFLGNQKSLNFFFIFFRKKL